MTAAIKATAITAPGVYDLPEDVYHAHDSLSSSGARTLVEKCAAIYHHERTAPRPPKAALDLGRAAHLLVLGAGPELFVTEESEWRTDKVKAEVTAARLRGAVPLKPAQFDTVQAMAAALRAHPDADDLFGRAGIAEQSLFWTDFATDVVCRARPDWMTATGLDDYKTTTDVSLPHIQRTIAEYGLHQQADWYLTGGIELDLIPVDARFRFIFQMKTDPYLVTVVELDDEALSIGRDRNRLALEMYRDCTAAGVWPGYSTGVETVSLPGYVARRHFEGAYA